MKHPITVVVAFALSLAGVGPRQALSQRQELVSVLGNAQGIGRHGADSALVQSAQPFAKTP